MPASTVRDILVIVAHPDLERSHTTRHLLTRLRADSVFERVELRDLYRLYPDYHVHVEAEQRALSAARLIVLLHPLQWFSMPALLKLWLDDVFRLGWAYGPGGTALQGKDFWLVTSTGGSAQSYSAAGHNRHPIQDFLLPYRQSALTCGLHYRAPQILHAAHRASDAELQAHAELFLARLAHYPGWCELPDEPTPGEDEAVALDERPPMFSTLTGDEE